MTDRFYPVGLPASEGAFKSTYEVQNEMRAFARSAFPPGTAVHQPGVTSSFGFSNPGPLRERLMQGHLHPTEAVDVPNPRENFAVPLLPEPDERRTFMTHDMDEMHRSCRSVTFTMASSDCGSRSGKSMFRARSLPALQKTPAPPRISEAPPAVDKFSNEHFSYFVPKGMQKDGLMKFNLHSMSKLQKQQRISFPFSGDGTGFRTQSGPTDIFPQGTYKDVMSSSQTAFAKPSYYRLSPLEHR